MDYRGFGYDCFQGGRFDAFLNPQFSDYCREENIMSEFVRISRVR